MYQVTNDGCAHVQVDGKRIRRQHWIAPEIVRKEATRSAIQHQYFSPEWFAEFKDYLHNGSPPFQGYLLEELCLIVAGTVACRYCIGRWGKSCSAFRVE